MQGVIRRFLGKSGKKWLVPFWNIPQTLKTGGLENENGGSND